MATAYAFSSISPYNNLLPPYEAGQLYSIDFEYTLLGTVVTGDSYTTPSGGLPNNGITIVDTQLIMPPLDTNATPTATISVGDAALATRFINAAQAGSATATQVTRFINQAQTLTAGVVSSGSGYVYGATAAAVTPPQIKVTVGGTVATAATTGTIRLRVSFYCSGQN